MKPMKKQKRVLAIFSICLMVGMGLAFLGSTGTASAAEVFKARYSYHWFPAHHLAVYSEKFAQLAKEETKGRSGCDDLSLGPALWCPGCDCCRFSGKR